MPVADNLFFCPSHSHSPSAVPPLQLCFLIVSIFGLRALTNMHTNTQTHTHTNTDILCMLRITCVLCLPFPFPIIPSPTPVVPFSKKTSEYLRASLSDFNARKLIKFPNSILRLQSICVAYSEDRSAMLNRLRCGTLTFYHEGIVSSSRRSSLSLLVIVAPHHSSSFRSEYHQDR